MTAPLGWVLLDQHTTNPNLQLHRDRDKAVAAVETWDTHKPDQAGRFVVCALVPDNPVTACQHCTCTFTAECCYCEDGQVHK